MGYREFGHKEILAIIVGILSVLVLSFAVKMLVPEAEEELLGPIGAVVTILIASLYGAFTGLLSGGAGFYAAYYVLYGENNYAVIFIMSVVGLIVGHYSKEYAIKDGQFRGKRILDFILIVLMALILGFVFVGPFVRFLGYKENIYELVNKGVNYSLVTFAAVAVICTPILCLVSKKMGGNSLTKDAS